MSETPNETPKPAQSPIIFSIEEVESVLRAEVDYLAATYAEGFLLLLPDSPRLMKRRRKHSGLVAAYVSKELVADIDSATDFLESLTNDCNASYIGFYMSGIWRLLDKKKMWIVADEVIQRPDSLIPGTARLSLDKGRADDDQHVVCFVAREPLFSYHAPKVSVNHLARLATLPGGRRVTATEIHSSFASESR